MDSRLDNYSSSFEEETTDSTTTKTRSIDSVGTKAESESGLELTRTRQSKSDTEGYSKTDNTRGDIDLTPWQKWLISKVSKKREAILDKDREQRLNTIEDKKLSVEKLQKQQLCDQKYKAWLASKNAEINHRRVQQERDAEAKRNLVETKRAEAQEKSRMEFNKWIKLKLNHDNDKKALLREKVQKDIRHQIEKRTFNEVEYSKWLQKASKISSPEYRCFGYTSGKLISWKC